METLITSTPRSGGDVRNTPDPRRWWALALLCGAFFMAILDAAIALVALPSIQADLAFSETILLLGCSAVLLPLSPWIESRHRTPLVPLRFLRSRTHVGAIAVMLIVGTLAVGMPFVLTLYAQQVLGYSALKFGVGCVVLVLSVTVGAIVAPWEAATSLND
jgi:MFS family permease